VVSLFALTGLSFVLSALHYPWRFATISGPYFNVELDILGAVTFFLAAAGLYRFDRRVRGFAIFLALCILLASAGGGIEAMGTIAILSVGLWFLAWLAALGWLLSSSVRAQFGFEKGHPRTA
jgi:hypothetical protein